MKREARLVFGFGADGRLPAVLACRRRPSLPSDVVRSFARGRRPHHPLLSRGPGRRPTGRCGGAPLAGQSVAVVESFAAGARNAGRRTIGHHRRRAAPSRPGRAGTEQADHRRIPRYPPPHPGRRAGAPPGGPRRGPPPGSTTRVRVGGPPVVFSGRIVHPEAPIPPTGLPVGARVPPPGTAWAEFRTLQTDAAGRLSYPYSFSDDDSNGVRFLFRAFVPATGGWAFAPATSRPLAVTG